MDKPLFEITADDLRECPEWFFPADESVEDEYVARPCVGGDRVSPDALRVQRCLFTDALGREFDGFVFHYADPSLAARQPNVWASGQQFAFWFGVRGPDDEYLRRLAEAFPAAAWPIRYRTDPRIAPALMGQVDGGYYLVDGRPQQIAWPASRSQGT